MHNTSSPARRLLMVGLLALVVGGAFAAGRHLSPGQAAGRDLVMSSPTPTHPHGLLTWTAFGGKRIADAQGTQLAQDGDTSDTPSPAEARPGATFQNVYDLLRANYVEGVPDDSIMAHGAASAMIASLADPNSRFLEPAQFAEAQAESKGQFAGLGASIAVRTTYTPKAADDPSRDAAHPSSVLYALTLVSVLPGSPAEKAGLHSGDVVTQIGDQWVASYDLVSAQAKALKAAQAKNDPVGLNHMIDALQKKLDTALSLAQAQAKLTDPAAKSVTLTVTRPGTPAPIVVTADTSTPVSLPIVDSKTLTSGVGYVHINVLDGDTAAAMAAALSAFGSSPKGVLVDLRGTVGDNIDAAEAIAGELSTAKTLGVREGKGQKDTTLPVTGTKTLSCPVAALVDDSTAGTAELLASALQAGGVKLVGGKTFGDDADVRLIPLHDGSGFTLTVGRLETASGTSFGNAGIAPDVAANGSPDAVMQQGVLALTGRMGAGKLRKNRYAHRKILGTDGGSGGAHGCGVCRRRGVP